jgi:hypothetical protein
VTDVLDSFYYFVTEILNLISQESKGYAGTHSELHVSVQMVCDVQAAVYVQVILVNLGSKTFILDSYTFPKFTTYLKWHMILSHHTCQQEVWLLSCLVPVKHPVYDQ